jgi:hypothetical protein
VRKLLLGTLALLPAVGCMQFRPVGILDPEGVYSRPPEVATPPEAPPPPAPVQLVSPNDVDPNNPQEAVRKLAEEIDADRKAMDQFPNYPRVSKVPAPK